MGVRVTQRSLSICNKVCHAWFRLSTQRGVCLSVSRPDCVLQPPPCLTRLSSTPCPLSTVSLKGEMCGERDEAHGQRKTNGKVQMEGRGKRMHGEEKVLSPLLFDHLKIKRSSLLCHETFMCCLFTRSSPLPCTPGFIFNPLKAFRWSAPFVYIRAPVDFLFFFSQTLWQWDKVMTLSFSKMKQSLPPTLRHSRHRTVEPGTGGGGFQFQHDYFWGEEKKWEKKSFSRVMAHANKVRCQFLMSTKQFSICGFRSVLWKVLSKTSIKKWQGI